MTPRPVRKKKKCLCNFRQHVVGDGCYVCNPELAKELSGGNMKKRKPKKREKAVTMGFFFNKEFGYWEAIEHRMMTPTGLKNADIIKRIRLPILQRTKGGR